MDNTIKLNNLFSFFIWTTVKAAITAAVEVLFLFRDLGNSEKLAENQLFFVKKNYHVFISEYVHIYPQKLKAFDAAFL